MKQIFFLILFALNLVACREAKDSDLLITDIPESIEGTYTLEEVRCEEGPSTYWKQMDHLQVTKTVSNGLTYDDVFDSRNGCRIWTESTFEHTGSFEYTSRIQRRICSSRCNSEQMQECQNPVGQSYVLSISRTGAVMIISDKTKPDDVCHVAGQTGKATSYYRLTVD